MATKYLMSSLAVCNPDYDYANKLVFIARWYSYEIQVMKHFYLYYYPYDNTIELYDKDTNRVYLKRSAAENIQHRDFFVGNTVRVYGRDLELIGYGDGYTQKIVSKTMEHTLILVKPGMTKKLGVVINELQKHEFKIYKLRMVNFTRREALEFFKTRKDDVSLPFQIEHMISGPCVGMEIVGYDAINRWQEVMGPQDPVEAKRTHPNSLRAKYGISKAENAFYGPADYKTAAVEACYFFPKDADADQPRQTLVLKNSTCCIIKPHVIYQGNLGNLIDSIQENPLFKITALRMVSFNSQDCEEFLEVYKGVIADVSALQLSMQGGPCVAAEICGKRDDIDVQQEFRKFAGPLHSGMARQVRPHSLRSLYGVDKYKNAVHCTDLPEDVELELEYVFKLLD